MKSSTCWYRLSMSIEQTNYKTQAYTEIQARNERFFGSDNEPLGNNANISVTTENIDENPTRNQTVEASKIEKIRYRMLKPCRDSLKFWLPKFNGQDAKLPRSTECHYGFIPSKKPTIQYNVANGASKYHNVKKCQKEYCPVCSVAVGIKKRDDLRIISAEASKLGFKSILLTLTIQHDASHTTEENVKATVKAWQKLSANTKFRRLLKFNGFKAYVRGIDETFNMENGLHMHLHVVLWFDGEVFDAGDWLNDPYLNGGNVSQIVDIWIDILEKLGRKAHRAIAIDVQIGEEYIAEYIAKHGTAPKEGRWDIAGEISSKSVKVSSGEHYSMFELMILTFVGDEWATKMYAEYVNAMKNQNVLSFSTLAKQLLDESDIDLYPAEETEIDPTRPNFKIPYDAWRVARNSVKRRAKWLELHENKLHDELLMSVARCEIVGKFQYKVDYLEYEFTEGWHTVSTVSLQGVHDFVEVVDIGQINVVNGVIQDVRILQDLRSGFYGKFIESEKENEGQT